MKKTLVSFVVTLTAWPLFPDFVSGQRERLDLHLRNIVIFVADGLRGGSVNATDAPTMFWVRNHGVNFANSYSLFPTFTTANASAIATGHYLGDTGDYSNTIYIGRPVFLSGNFGRAPGTYAPYIENDPVLGDRLTRELERCERLVDILAADEGQHEPGLLRGGPHVF